MQKKNKKVILLVSDALHLDTRSLFALRQNNQLVLVNIDAPTSISAEIDNYQIDLSHRSTVNDFFIFLKKAYPQIDLIFLDVGLKTFSLDSLSKNIIDYNVEVVLNFINCFLKLLNRQETGELLITYSIGNQIIGPKLKRYSALPFMRHYLQKDLRQKKKGVAIEFLSPEMFFQDQLYY